MKYSYLLINKTKWKIFDHKGYPADEGFKDERLPESTAAKHPFMILVHWQELKQMFCFISLLLIAIVMPRILGTDFATSGTARFV